MLDEPLVKVPCPTAVDMYSRGKRRSPRPKLALMERRALHNIGYETQAVSIWYLGDLSKGFHAKPWCCMARVTYATYSYTKIRVLSYAYS